MSVCRSTWAWVCVVGLGLVVVGCGPKSLSGFGTTAATINVGGGSRAIQTLTDLDTVRGVAASGDHVYVATDLGLLVHLASGSERPLRVRMANGLPSEDVTAVVADRDGNAIVATAAGLAKVDPSGTVTSFGDPPPVGRVTALVALDDGTLFAGGVEGLARRGDDGWKRFGESAAVTTLVPTPEGQLWVGTTNGLWMIDGETIREHAWGRGLPEPWVRSIVPVRPGEVMVLVAGSTDSKLGYWDGTRWWSYTIDGLEVPAVALVRRGSDVVLVTPAHALAIAPDSAGNAVPLTPLDRSELRGVRSYGARITAPEDVEPPAEGREPPANVDRDPTALARVPEHHPTLDAPPFGVRALSLEMPEDCYWAMSKGTELYLADRNRGVTRMNDTGFVVRLRSQDLVVERDLQIAVDASRNTYVLGRDGTVALYRDGRLTRMRSPEGVSVQALASGPDGAYVIARVGTEAAVLRLYRVATDGFTQQMERQLTVEPPLVSVPFFGMTDEREVWVGLRVVNETGESPRMRGVAVFREEGPVVYHHRNADPERDGPGALRMPDEVEEIDLNQTGYAWFPSLFGAIRVGNSQAIVFDEARGVRGEVVTDVTVGEGDRVWIAAAEGVGYYEDRTFEFRLPAVVQQSRPTAIALDTRGNVWAAGPNGIAYNDGTTWQRLTEENGLPTNALVDVEVDAEDRVWMLAEDRVILFSRAQTPPPPSD